MTDSNQNGWIVLGINAAKTSLEVLLIANPIVRLTSYNPTSPHRYV